MANKKNDIETVFMRGKLQYARVLGDPVLNYNKDGKEWKFDFIPLDEKEAAKTLKGLGVADRLRSLTDSEDNPRYNGQKYMSFKQKATKADGSDNQPIRVVDAMGEPWPESKLLGNDTIVDLKFVVIDNGPNRFAGVYPRSMRVMKLEEYSKNEWDDVDEDDELYKEAMAAIPEKASINKEVNSDDDNSELDDDLPI